ncbi:MAG: hypothetical protein QW103_02945 [Candidatus Pacearchaeota archaeon]
MNKRGLHVAIWIIIVIALTFMGLFFWSSVSTRESSFDLKQLVAESKPINEALGLQDGFKPLMYIFGSVPQAVINASSEIGGAIIIIAIWFILFLMFGDILDVFGMFSKVVRKDKDGKTIIKYSPVAWLIAFALVLVAANFKVIMYLAVLGFAITSSIGIFASILGVLMPFLLYILLHFAVLRNWREYMNKKIDEKTFSENMSNIKRGIKAYKEAGETVLES